MKFPVVFLDGNNPCYLTCYLNSIKSAESKLTDKLIILFIVKGEIEISIGQNTYLLKEEDVFLVNKWSIFTLVSLKENIISFYEIDIEKYTEFCEEITLRQFINAIYINTEIAIEELDYLKSILTKILIHSIRRKEDYFLRCSSYITELLVLLLKKYSIETETLVNNSHRRYEGIVRFINENYMNKISLDDIAKEFFINPQYASRYFSKHIGMTINEYITEVRLKHAIKHLIEEKLKITQIPFEIGFPNEKSFFKAFKEKYKITPAKYQKEYINNKVKMNNEIDTSKLFDMEILCKIMKYLNYKYVIPGIFEEDKLITDVDLNNKGITLNKYWGKIQPGYEDGDIYKEKWRKDFSLMQKELRYEKFRVNNILYSKNEIFYINYDEIDNLIEFIKENKLIPIFSIKVQFQVKTTLLLEIIDSFIYNLIVKYGDEVYNNWGYEFDLRSCNDENELIYFREKLAEIIEKYELKEIGILLDNLKSDIVKFIINELNNKITFVSLLYSENNKMDDNKLSYYIKTFNYLNIENHVGIRKLYIIGWDTCSAANFVNDTAYKGCQIVKTICENIGKIDALSYNYLSDSSINENIVSKEFFGGAGILSKNSFKKESYYSFWLLNKLGTILISLGESYIVTKNKFDEIQILTYNFCELKKEINAENNMLLYSDVYESFNERIKKILVTLKNINGNYIKKKYTINKVKGSPYNEWIEIGKPKYLDKSDINYISGKAIYEYKVKNIFIDSETTIGIKLFPHEITLIELIPIP